MRAVLYSGRETTPGEHPTPQKHNSVELRCGAFVLYEESESERLMRRTSAPPRINRRTSGCAVCANALRTSEFAVVVGYWLTLRESSPASVQSSSLYFLRNPRASRNSRKRDGQPATGPFVLSRTP